jgi:hypothetical protein
MNTDHIFGIPTVLATPLITAISAILAVVFTNYFAIRRLRKEMISSLEKEKYNRTLNACQNGWKLLRFTTDIENPDAILIWKRDKTTKTDQFYFRKDRAELFIKQLSLFFYEEGHGVFLPGSVRPLLFEYRSIIYGLILSEKNNTADEILINNEKMVERMKTVHQNLIKTLRNHVKADDNGLPQS